MRRVRYVRNALTVTGWAVMVCGADDEGYSWETPSERSANRMFGRINHLVSKRDLTSWGFGAW